MRIQFLEKKRQKTSYSQFHLKIIATISMLIDHIGVVLIYNGKLYGYDQVLYKNVVNLPEAKTWLLLYRICRMIGRISFPIFIFLIVEGYRKTSNVFKYSLRILILALISEIPFDLILFNRLICFDTQNVLFTYFIALIMLSFLRFTRSYPIFFHMIIATISVLLCKVARTDYWLEGILLAFVFYMFRHDLYLKCIISGVIVFASTLLDNFGFGVFAIYFIFLYDENKGIIDIKKFSYVFYPLHMLVLYGIVYFSYCKV